MEDKHFIHNDKVSESEYVEAVTNVLSSSPLKPVFEDARNLWATFIMRVCMEYGLSPIWVLICFQREQGLLTTLAQSVWEFKAACGFVGQDQPGVKNPLFLGFPSQVWRCARQTAWFAGIGPKELFGLHEGLLPTAPRWEGAPITIELLDSTHQKTGELDAQSMADYIQLKYTPHQKVLQTNQQIYSNHLAKIFDPLLPEG